jgi:hypothetical protein
MSSAFPFKRWRLYWFQCPHCAFSSYSAYARPEVLEQPTRLLIRYRCRRCGQDSRLKHPYLNLVIGFVVSIAFFVVMYRLLLTEEGWTLSLVLSVLIGVGIIWTLYCGLTRILNRYVPIARGDL